MFLAKIIYCHKHYACCCIFSFALRLFQVPVLAFLLHVVRNRQPIATNLTLVALFFFCFVIDENNSFTFLIARGQEQQRSRDLTNYGCILRGWHIQCRCAFFAFERRQESPRKHEYHGAFVRGIGRFTKEILHICAARSYGMCTNQQPNTMSDSHNHILRVHVSQGEMPWKLLEYKKSRLPKKANLIHPDLVVKPVSM